MIGPDPIPAPDPDADLDDTNPELSPAGVAVVDVVKTATTFVPPGFRSEFDKLVAKGVIRPDGSTVGAVVAPVVIASPTPEVSKAKARSYKGRTSSKSISVMSFNCYCVSAEMDVGQIRAEHRDGLSCAVGSYSRRH